MSVPRSMVRGMTEWVIAFCALAAGLVLGAAMFALRRGETAARGDNLTARLDAHAAELRRVADAAAVRDGAGEQMRSEIAGARRALEELRTRERERWRAEQDDREVIRRLSTVLAGGASKGRAGENLLREHLSQLPPAM